MKIFTDPDNGEEHVKNIRAHVREVLTGDDLNAVIELADFIDNDAPMIDAILTKALCCLERRLHALQAAQSA